MEKFLAKLLYIFLAALGMIIGGTLIGSIAATVEGHSPQRTMLELAKDLKIWAAVAAIGGTFDFFQNLETGLLEGQLRAVIKQLGFVFAAFAGAHLGYVLVMALAESKR